MPHIDARATRRCALAVILVISGLVIAACGSSASGSSKTSTTASAQAGAGAGRFAALRECMQKNGITLPQHKPGAGRPGGGGGLPGGGAGPQLPKGVTRAQYEAAIKKCGGGAFGSGARLNSAAYRQRLTKFAECMRQGGISLPAPDTTGKGPVFNTNGLNTASAKFVAAESKCRSILRPTRTGSSAPGAAGG
ncbi:MAG TPA: hypothetical protein VII01_11710 [Solirubrobacteraceae bacterium]|jgi:hypothetical protein